MSVDTDPIYPILAHDFFSTSNRAIIASMRKLYCTDNWILFRHRILAASDNLASYFGNQLNGLVGRSGGEYYGAAASSKAKEMVCETSLYLPAKCTLASAVDPV
jgi:hypothetical protein